MSAGVVEHATNEQPQGGSRPHGKPSTAKSWLKAIELTSRIEANPNRLFADIIADWAERQPDRPALMSDDATFSYRELNERIHRYARWALAAGIGKGDTICLLLPAQPDYLAAWLGLTSVGAVAALINTKLVGSSLAHCIDVAQASHIIVGQELEGVFEEVRPRLKRAPKIWWHGEEANEPDLQ